MAHLILGIEWLDTATRNGWRINAQDDETLVGAPCYSVGFLVREDDGSLLRLDALCTDATATVLLAFREPVATAASLQRQHDEIDAVNATYADFRVLKGVEADILPCGRVDYPVAVLERRGRLHPLAGLLAGAVVLGALVGGGGAGG